jgi:hypothetical protein
LIAPFANVSLLSQTTGTLKSGKIVGTIPFTRGPPAHLLRSRFYVVNMIFKSEVLKANNKPLSIERAGSVARVPAGEIEAVVIKSVREHVKPRQAIDDCILIEIYKN